VIRGRVLARAGRELIVRGEGGDVTVTVAASHAPGLREARPGDLVEVAGDVCRVVVAGASADYPGPGSEVARLPRSRMRNLAGRSRGLAAVRAFFAARDFIEIEAPLLVRAPALEVNLDAVAADGGFLITSPEYQMKRLLAAGFERIYSLGKCFRAGEDGHQHGIEFTMLEWYRAWDGWTSILADTEALVAEVAHAVTGGTVVEQGGRRLDLSPPWPRMTVAEAMSRHAGVEVAGDESAEVLAGRVRAAGIELGTAEAWDDVFFTAFVERVEPALAALDHPVAVTDWPAPLGALARPRPDDPRVVERFEVYAGGLELCNAFGELTDASEQRRRFAADQAMRRARGKAVHAMDERLLAALAEGLPPSAGIALGIDRLLMLVLGVGHIRDVLAFGHDEL
jgi:lysyl-tRNA synthetase class 2